MLGGLTLLLAAVPAGPASAAVGFDRVHTRTSESARSCAHYFQENASFEVWLERVKAIVVDDGGSPSRPTCGEAAGAGESRTSSAR